MHRIPSLLFLSAVVAHVLSPPTPLMGSATVNVRDFGAKGDGSTDDTSAFLRALSRVDRGGGCLKVPPGEYVLSRTLHLENIVLMGTANGSWSADGRALPTILPAHRDSPAFELAAGGAICGIDITYHWQEEPKHGAPAILVRGIGASVRDLRLRYPWEGIITDGTHNVGRLQIENVFIVSPRQTGVRVTGTWDVPRLNNVEVWNAGPVARGMNEGVGFHLGKNDLIRLTDCFVFGMKYGFLLEDRISGCKIEGSTWGVMNGCATDFCGIGIAVRGNHTLSVSGGSFWNHASSLVVDGEEARVRVTGCELKSNGAPVVVIRRCDHTIVTGSTIRRPMPEHRGPAVLLSGGTAVIANNHIRSVGNAVEVRSGIRGVTLEGNIFRAPGSILIADDLRSSQRIIEKQNLVVPWTPQQK